MAMLGQSWFEIIRKEVGIGWRGDAEKVQFNSLAAEFGAEVNDLKSSGAYQRYTSCFFYPQARNWFPLFAASNAVLLNRTIGRSWDELAICASH